MNFSQERNEKAGSVGETKYHNFEKSLKMSHEAEDLPFWGEVYRKAFPGMVAMVNHREDGEWQRAGIDRSLILKNSKQILIDEKVRGRNKLTGKVYTDIALEYWSDEERQSPGWVCKPLRADYIAYAIAPIGKCYLLPVIQLQIAWNENSSEWIENYRRIKARNKYNGNVWTTISVPVPVSELFSAIGKGLRVSFHPMEID